jgi:hypothetical protein
MTDVSVLERVAQMGLDFGLELDVPDLFVVAEAVLRVELEGVDPGSAAGWARTMLNIETDIEHLISKGASVRAIAQTTGLSKSTVARLIKRRAAIQSAA